MAESPRDPRDSVRRRYAVTLTTQFLRWSLSFIVTAGFVPRCLGPVVYGNYNFLLNASSTLRGFLDPSAQQAFFTFSSQEKRSGALTKLYALTLFGQILIAFLFIGLASFFNKLNWFLPGQKLDQVLWVTLVEWSIFFAASLQQMGDCKGLTVHTQLIGASASIINVAGLLGLALLRKLNFYSYVGVNLMSALLAVIALGYWLLRVHADLCWQGVLYGQIRPLLKRWWHFASPLLLLEYYGPIISFLNVYLIQFWYGATEQGNYSLAVRWSSPVLAFASAAMMIFWREIAHLTATGELERARQIYLRFNRLLLFLALVLACWLSLSCPTLIPMLAGKQYAPAVPVLMIMAFYPVVQTLGHLTSASFKATERTVLFRDLGMLLSIPDLLLAYFLLAKPTSYLPGLHLGAIGVALRLVIYGFLATEVYSWLDFRFFGLNYKRWLFGRIAISILIGSLALLTLQCLNHVLRACGVDALTSLGLASVPYFAALSALVYVWPGIVGLSRNDFSEYAQILLRKVHAGADRLQS